MRFPFGVLQVRKGNRRRTTVLGYCFQSSCTSVSVFRFNHSCTAVLLYGLQYSCTLPGTSCGQGRGLFLPFLPKLHYEGGLALMDSVLSSLLLPTLTFTCFSFCGTEIAELHFAGGVFEVIQTVSEEALGPSGILQGAHKPQNRACNRPKHRESGCDGVPVLGAKERLPWGVLWGVLGAEGEESSEY